METVSINAFVNIYLSGQWRKDKGNAHRASPVAVHSEVRAEEQVSYGQEQ